MQRVVSRQRSATGEQMGSRERVNRQTDRDSTAIGRSGRRRVESRGGRLEDQESGAEEQTG